MIHNFFEAIAEKFYDFFEYGNPETCLFAGIALLMGGILVSALVM